MSLDQLRTFLGRMQDEPALHLPAQRNEVAQLAGTPGTSSLVMPCCATLA